MRRALTVLTVLILLLASTQAPGAGKRKMKWLASIYEGPAGVALKNPEGVACRGKDVVVADTGNGRLLHYTYDGETATAGTVLALEKSAPLVVQMTSKGSMYFLDGMERRIAGVSKTGESLGYLSPRGLPSSAKMVAKSFRIDDEDNIYVLDVFSARVVVLDPEGSYVRHLAFPAEYGFFSDLAVDRQGRIFLLDSVEAVVYSATRAADEFSPLTDGLGEYVNFPTALTLDDRGVIYVVDQYGSGLALLGQDGSFLGRRLGMGWSDGGLYFPTQMCISEDGVAFIADRNNSRVQLFGVSGD